MKLNDIVFMLIFWAFLKVFLSSLAISHTRKGRASIREPDDIKNKIGMCFYWTIYGSFFSLFAEKLLRLHKEINQRLRRHGKTFHDFLLQKVLRKLV